MPADTFPRELSYSTARRSSCSWGDIPTTLAPGQEEQQMTSATRPEPVPGACQGVAPALIVHGGVRALDFYAAVFEATARRRIPGLWETIDHAEIAIGDSILIVEDESPYKGTKAPPTQGLDGFPFLLRIYVEDVGAVVDLAVERGASVQHPPRDMFCGGHDAFIVDPFGHGWTIASHVEDVASDGLMRQTTELQRER